MTKYFVEGRVIPERVDFNLPKINLGLKLNDNQLSIDVYIIKSKIFIHVGSGKSISHADLRNAMFTVVGNIINYAGFRYVLGISYELDSITDLNTNTSVVFGTEGYVFDDVSEFGAKLTFTAEQCGSSVPLTSASVQDQHLFRATFELRNAIRYPDFTALHCRLAIEAIRNGFDPNSEPLGWAALRSSLNIERSTIESFKDVSAAQRHGQNMPQTWEERRRCMQIAWEIVHRYTRYLDVGDLSLNDYQNL